MFEHNQIVSDMYVQKQIIFRGKIHTSVALK